MNTPVPYSKTSCSGFRNTDSRLHTCVVPSKHLLSANAGGAFDTNARQQKTEQEVKDMNKNSLLAATLIAAVCTGTGRALRACQSRQTRNFHEGRDTKVPSITGTPKDRIWKRDIEVEL